MTEAMKEGPKTDFKTIVEFSLSNDGFVVRGVYESTMTTKHGTKTFEIEVARNLKEKDQYAARVTPYYQRDGGTLRKVHRVQKFDYWRGDIGERSLSEIAKSLAKKYEVSSLADIILRH